MASASNSATAASRSCNSWERVGWKLAVVGALWSAGHVACLPRDSRPEPGSVQLTVEPTDETAGGFTTADGWRVEFERLLFTLGEVELSDLERGANDCVDYTQSRFMRVFDFVRPGREDLGLLFGLGPCDVRWEFGPPATDSVLGPGVSERDRERLRTATSDRYVEDKAVSLLAEGMAQRDGVEVRFAWAFRQNVELSDCGYLSGDSGTLDVVGGEHDEVRVIVDGLQLFRDRPDHEAPTRFEPFSRADADADGELTLAELAEVDAPEGFSLQQLDLEEVPIPPELSLADVVYLVQVPGISRIADGGRCRFEIEDFINLFSL